MLNLILVDDELAALEELTDKLQQLGGAHLAGKYQDPVAALEEIRRNPPDAAFLDIMMREIDGFTLAGEILQMARGIDIVFVTAYDEFAVKAFEMNAVDYLLKPVAKERLGMTLRKIIKNRERLAPQSRESLESFIQVQRLQQSVKKVPVWKDDRIFLLNPHEISYFTVENEAVTVVTGQGRFYSRDSLNFWESRLKGERFFRTHKSFLVNLDNIKQVAPFFNYTYLLKLEGIKEEIPVSRSYLKAFKQIML
ncbi:MAG TPA: LytTR family DNA-binding domain-containing protein [Bacillota bacterium]|nr:LytTR family DNA-binding domain-containing protein [Bacillota bacterium]